MARVMHFEIPAGEPEKIGKFYIDVFDWKIKQWEDQPYWLVETGSKDQPGINGAIYKKSPEMSRAVNTVQVDDLDAYMEKIKQCGGTIIGEPREIPHVGRNVMAEDPEGNLFGLLQPSEEMMKM